VMVTSRPATSRTCDLDMTFTIGPA
jgi:hypothetical protein